MSEQPQRGFVDALIGDGRPLISFCGICLGLSGLFAILQAMSGHFLPQDTAYLKMQAEDLCQMNECRIVHFMIHDRVSFGGALVAIAVLYLWLAEFPLRSGEAWAWWALVISGLTGFGSFLTYLGYGYLDTWHGTATLMLLPCYTLGVWRLRPTLALKFSDLSPYSSLRPTGTLDPATSAGIGRILLAWTASGMIAAGLTIQVIGMTTVFVETDLAYMEIDRSELNRINPRLIPLIAHDRAGFGGAVFTAGILTLMCIWFGTPSVALWQVLLIGGLAGWSTAVFVHPVIGYTDTMHLAPAVLGAVAFFSGLICVKREMTFLPTQQP